MGQLGSRLWGADEEEEEWTETEEGDVWPADGEEGGGRPAAPAESMGLGLTALRERMLAVAAGTGEEETERRAEALGELGREMDRRIRRGLAGWQEAASEGRRRAAAAEAEERTALGRLAVAERARAEAEGRAAAAEEAAGRTDQQRRLADERAERTEREAWRAAERAERESRRERLRADQADARNASLEAQLSRTTAALHSSQLHHQRLLDDLRSSSTIA